MEVSSLKTEIQKKVMVFAESIRKNLGDNLAGIILFGSRARGDYQEGSDYDFVFIVRRKTPEVKKTVSDEEIIFLDTNNELAGSIIYDESDWEGCKKFPLGYNIKKEGISL